MRAACTVRSRAVGMPSRRSLALPGFGIIRSRTGRGLNCRDFRSCRSCGRNPPQRTGSIRAAARRPHRPFPSVAPDPCPRRNEDGRVSHEVEQVVEPAWSYGKVEGVPILRSDSCSGSQRCQHQQPPSVIVLTYRSRIRCPGFKPTRYSSCRRQGTPSAWQVTNSEELSSYNRIGSLLAQPSLPRSASWEAY